MYNQGTHLHHWRRLRQQDPLLTWPLFCPTDWVHLSYPMGVGQLSESDAVDALRLPFYSSSHPTGSHGWRNQFDLGNPD